MVRQVIEHGGRVVEVPIRFVDRVEGISKMSTAIVVEAFLLVTWWGWRGHRGLPCASCAVSRCGAGQPADLPPDSGRSGFS